MSASLSTSYVRPVRTGSNTHTKNYSFPMYVRSGRNRTLDTAAARCSQLCLCSPPRAFANIPEGHRFARVPFGFYFNILLVKMVK